jgi:hypothetical protein
LLASLGVYISLAMLAPYHARKNKLEVDQGYSINSNKASETVSNIR